MLPHRLPPDVSGTIACRRCRLTPAASARDKAFDFPDNFEERRHMIIDCHGHYTTEPKDLHRFRKEQTAAANTKDKTAMPSRAALMLPATASPLKRGIRA